MKSDHFIYKRQHTHSSHKKGQDNILDLSECSVAEKNSFDFSQQEFSIEELKPSHIKRYQNLEAYPHAFETDRDILSWIAAMMTESPLGNAILKYFESKNWLICLSELENSGYNLDIEEKTLEIDNFGLDSATIGRSTLFRNTILVNFARALRDIWHEERNYSFLETYTPDSAMLLERVRVADIDAVAVFIGWELRSAGYKDVWRHLLGAEDSDMAQVLLNISDAHPTSIYNGMAIAHIFRQWYADAIRIDAVDHMFLENLDLIVDDKDAKIGTRKPLPEVIEQMAILMDGTSYLKDVSETVLRDPFFCKLEDSINEAHLFQIVYDLNVTMREGVPFRDERLARKIFPEGMVSLTPQE